MTTPALIRTYESNSELIPPFFQSNDDTATREVLHVLKDMYIGQSHYGFNGTINEITPGVEYELVASNQGGSPIRNPSGDFTIDGDLVGRIIEIENATSPGNNGFFTVTQVVDANTIRYSNAGGVAEAFSGDFRVSNGKHTGRGGGFTHWKPKGSSAGTTGKGAAMDGRDRWLSSSDRQLSSNRTSGNHSWFVLENTASGCEYMFSDAPCTVFRRPHVWVSPEVGFTGGATNADPSAADEYAWCGNGSNNTGYLFMHEDWNSSIAHRLIFCCSTDGQQGWMACDRNGIPQGISLWAKAANPYSGGSPAWTGNNNVIAFANGRNINQVNVNHVDHPEFNDVAALTVTLDHLGASSGPSISNCYLTAGFFANTAYTQDKPNTKDALGGWPFDRISLVAGSVGLTGRIGTFPDMYWSGNDPNQGVVQYNFFPDDGSRRFVKFGTFLLPWDGSKIVPLS